MAKVTLHNLGTIVRERRGRRGLRATAAEIGTSAPTLSRIESGKMPDLQTFGKLCRWLELDPASLLGVSPRQQGTEQPNAATAHLKADREIAPETARAPGERDNSSTTDDRRHARGSVWRGALSLVARKWLAHCGLSSR